MATWGVEARIVYRAWNTSTNAGVAGDSANHTLTLRRAGTDSAFVGTVNDLGSGVYEAVVSGTLAEVYELAMRGTSATADVVLFFESPVRTVKASMGALTPEQATWLEETHEKAMLIGTGQAFVEVPIDGDSNITVRRSRDYQQADGLAIEWSNPDGTWPDLTGATIVARVARPGCKTSALYDFAASVVTPTGSQIVRLELTKAQLAIIADDYTYELVATLSSGHIVTLVDGQFRVILGRDAP